MDRKTKYQIGGREFDLKLLGPVERERVRDLWFRLVIWRDEQPLCDVLAGCPLPAELAAEVSAFFLQVAGFPYTEILDEVDCWAWDAVLTACEFDRLPDGTFDIFSGVHRC